MKKLFVSLVMAVVLPLTACVNDRPIGFDELPADAKNFITQHFADVKVSLVTIDRDAFETTYDVVLADGSSMEFDGKGRWKDVDCGRNALPAGIVPEAITQHVAANYPDYFVYDISRDRHDWGLSLREVPQAETLQYHARTLELKFDTAFRLIEIDD